MSGATVDKAAIEALPVRAQCAFCAACLEHGLPLYAHTTGRDDLRPAVEYLWAVADGDKHEPSLLKQLEAAVGSSIPDSEEDGGDLTGAMHRAVGVAVLEALDVPSGHAEAAARVAFGILDAVDVAELLFRRHDAEAESEDDAPEIAEELLAQARLLERLAESGGRDASRDRGREQAWGRELLSRFHAEERG